MMIHNGTNVQPRPLLITAGIHVLLLLILLLWKFTLPAQPQPVQDFGMEVNLGTSDNGSGADQPMDVEDPAASAAAHTSAASQTGQAEIERSDETDAPSIAPANRTARSNMADNMARRSNGSRTGAVTQPTRQTQQPKYTYTGSTGQGGNSAAQNRAGTGEGIAGGTGDQGVPGGTPGASNYSGIPGIGTSGLQGRTIERAPIGEERFREGGKVILRVTVNRDGEIVNKSVKSSPNSELSAVALRRVERVRFNKSETAPEEQFGTITFVFKTRQ